MTVASNTPKRSNLTLWLILAVCVAPFVAATVVSRYFPPGARMNYGDLIEPLPLPDVGLTTLDGKVFQISALRGKWLMIHVDTAACPPECAEKLWKLRQLRLTQGKNMERLERLWLVTDNSPVDPKLQQEYAGTVILRASPELLRMLPAKGGTTTHIWLADPLGNVMMRYEPGADPSRIKGDLIRLLKVSQIG